MRRRLWPRGSPPKVWRGSARAGCGKRGDDSRSASVSCASSLQGRLARRTDQCTHRADPLNIPLPSSIPGKPDAAWERTCAFWGAFQRDFFARLPSSECQRIADAGAAKQAPRLKNCTGRHVTRPSPVALTARANLHKPPRPAVANQPPTPPARPAARPACLSSPVRSSHPRPLARSPAVAVYDDQRRSPPCPRQHHGRPAYRRPSRSRVS
jgi:hypothetical protein